MFVPPITPKYTSSRYANKKYCLFYVNLTVASNDYVWDSDKLYNMSINLIKLNVNVQVAWGYLN